MTLILAEELCTVDCPHGVLVRPGLVGRLEAAEIMCAGECGECLAHGSAVQMIIAEQTVQPTRGIGIMAVQEMVLVRLDRIRMTGMKVRGNFF